VGVDGFRLDAIKHIVEDGANQENTPATHAFWEGFYDYYTSITPEALTVGEAWTSRGEVVKYIGDEVNIAFEFDTSGAMVSSARDEKSTKVFQAHALDLQSYPAHQYGVFLTNHDQTRVMTELRGDPGKAKSAASLLLTGPGVPFLYYGEEVGQKGSKPDENLRAIMQWSGETNAGFTSAALPWRLPQRGYEEANVAIQTDVSNSLLSHYRTLIHARNTNPALQTGVMLQLPSDNRGVYAFLRYTEDQTLLVLINLTGKPLDDYRFCLSNGNLQAGTATEILYNTLVNAPNLNNAGGFDDYRPIDELAPYSTYIIQLR
jgi:alpha-amylase